jgi:hypothetical protein
MSPQRAPKPCIKQPRSPQEPPPILKPRSMKL